MILRIFSVFDTQAKSYIAPFFLPEVGQAKREFSNAANDPNHKFSRNPEDYILDELGQFDDNSGTIDTYDHPERLGSAAQFKTQE